MLISPALLFLQADRSGLPLFRPRYLIPGAAIHSCPVHGLYLQFIPPGGRNADAAVLFGRSEMPQVEVSGQCQRPLASPLAVDENGRMSPGAAFVAQQVGIVGDRRLEPGVDTPPAGLVTVLDPFVPDELMVALAVGRIDEDVVLPVQQRVVSQPVGSSQVDWYPCLFFST